jgi:hypothetical protein
MILWRVFLSLGKTLTSFGNLKGEIDTIDNLGGMWDIDNEVVVWGSYVYFSKQKKDLLNTLHPIASRE